MFNYVDIHSHLYFPDFDTDREEEIEKIKQAGIATITIGTDFKSSQQAIELAERHHNLFACIGQHPGDVTVESVFDERLLSLAQHPRVVSIGECGLDYFRMSPHDEVLKSIQKNIFEQHINLSLSSGKPLMLHVRSSKGSMDAYSDTLDMLESRARSTQEKLRGNAHFFAGNMEVLIRFLALGFTVSFTGVLTFTHDYDDLVKAVPLDRLLSETDAPFVAPVPYRGSRNSPLYVPEVVSCIAQIRQEPLEVVKKVLLENAQKLFGIGVAPSPVL